MIEITSARESDGEKGSDGEKESDGEKVDTNTLDITKPLDKGRVSDGAVMERVLER